MKLTKKVLRPVYDDEEEDDLDRVLLNNQLDEDGDEISKLSFGSLNSAQNKLLNRKGKKRQPVDTGNYNDDKAGSISRSASESDDFDSDSDSGSGSGSESDGSEPDTNSYSKSKFNKQDHKRRNKHAPSESSSKKFVSKIRKIPGLETKSQSLYGDIRFDATYGKADLIKTRKNYAFLDEYRQDEIKSMENILKDGKSKNLLTENQQLDIKNQIQSLKSRLNTMKNKDLEHKILTEFKQKQLANFKSGKQSNPYFLKQSEKRKLLQKARFDGMKAQQREKVMERKRKKRLGKEFKQLEFRNQ